MRCQIKKYSDQIGSVKFSRTSTENSEKGELLLSTVLSLALEELLQDTFPQKEKEAMYQEKNTFSCCLDLDQESSLRLLFLPSFCGEEHGWWHPALQLAAVLAPCELGLSYFKTANFI